MFSYDTKPNVDMESSLKRNFPESLRVSLCPLVHVVRVRNAWPCDIGLNSVQNLSQKVELINVTVEQPATELNSWSIAMWLQCLNTCSRIRIRMGFYVKYSKLHSVKHQPNNWQAYDCWFQHCRESYLTFVHLHVLHEEHGLSRSIAFKLSLSPSNLYAI